MADNSFTYNEDPIDIVGLTKTLGGRPKAVEAVLLHFSSSGRDLVGQCRRCITDNEKDFQAASHTLKGSSGLIKTTRLYPLASCLSDVAKYEPGNTAKKELVLAAVERESATVFAFITEILPQLNADTVPQPRGARPVETPIDYNRLLAALGNNAGATREAIETMVRQGSTLVVSIRQKLAAKEPASAVSAAESLFSSAETVCAPMLLPVAIGCLDTLVHEPDNNIKLDVMIAAADRELLKIDAFAKFLRRSAEGLPVVSYEALVAQFGGNTNFVKMVLSQFITTGRTRLEAFAKAQASGDKKVIHTEAHAINGEAGMLKLDALYAVSQALSKATDEEPDNTTLINQLLGRIKDEFARVEAFFASK